MGPHKKGDTGFTIKYSKRKVKIYRDEKKLLHKKVNNLQARAEKTRISNTSYSSFNVRDLVLKNYVAILRSKVRWYEGERNTKYFYSL